MSCLYIRYLFDKNFYHWDSEDPYRIVYSYFCNIHIYDNKKNDYPCYSIGKEYTFYGKWCDRCRVVSYIMGYRHYVMLDFYGSSKYRKNTINIPYVLLMSEIL